MSENQNPSTPSYINRVLSSDALKKGAATALAGLVVAAITEALFPSES